MSFVKDNNVNCTYRVIDRVFSAGSAWLKKDMTQRTSANRTTG